jgi:anthranilate/para-aminobenzoate synthase component II
MILVIDNYDSFTYNLVQYFGELGADLLVKRNDEITLADIAKLAPEKIVVSPGPCSPTEAGISCDTRYHSLIVKRETLPPCLKITAETAEGEIMGLAHRELPVYGVQFHPESILTQHGKQMLKNFLTL